MTIWLTRLVLKSAAAGLRLRADDHLAKLLHLGCSCQLNLAAPPLFVAHANPISKNPTQGSCKSHALALMPDDARACGMLQDVNFKQGHTVCICSSATLQGKPPPGDTDTANKA